MSGWAAVSVWALARAEWRGVDWSWRLVADQRATGSFERAIACTLEGPDFTICRHRLRHGTTEHRRCSELEHTGPPRPRFDFMLRLTRGLGSCSCSVQVWLSGIGVWGGRERREGQVGGLVQELGRRGGGGLSHTLVTLH